MEVASITITDRMASEKQQSSLAYGVAAGSTMEAPPSYEAIASNHIDSPPLPPRNDDAIPVVRPRENVESVDSQIRLIPAGYATRSFRGGLYYNPGIGSAINDAQNHEAHRFHSTIWGTIMIATGVDLAWSTFTFGYVLSTWLTSLCLMIIPIIGIPLYFLFAVTWRALAHVDLIFTSLLFPTDQPLKPFVPPPPILSPAIQEHIVKARSIEVLRNDRSPAICYNWETAKLTMFAKSTWRALLYFIIPRFVLSVVTFCIFWAVIFPFWLIFGVGCMGFGWTPGKVVRPMVKLMAAFPKLAVSSLSERTF
ncbi:hypothetical protein BJ742DRAFT_869220 [Cladochytrium replicatum]|nr:hypothetical protein BJ742DRAFT_869220 [Cladochytrium replicatum]